MERTYNDFDSVGGRGVSTAEREHPGIHKAAYEKTHIDDINSFNVTLPPIYKTPYYSYCLKQRSPQRERTCRVAYSVSWSRPKRRGRTHGENQLPSLDFTLSACPLLASGAPALKEQGRGVSGVSTRTSLFDDGFIRCVFCIHGS